MVLVTILFRSCSLLDALDDKDVDELAEVLMLPDDDKGDHHRTREGGTAQLFN